LTLNNIKGHAVSFGEGFKAIALNFGEMNEHVRSVVLLDKTETLGVVEPLHCTFCHLLLHLPLYGVFLLCKSKPPNIKTQPTGLRFVPD